MPAAVIIIGKPRSNAPRALDHRAVAGQVRLAAQHVHALRPGGARQQLHGSGVNAGRSEGRHDAGVGVGVADAHQQHPARNVAEHVLPRHLHREHDVRPGQGCPGVRCDLRARRLEVGVGQGACRACAGLDRDGQAHADQLLHRVRRRRHTGLRGRPFLQHREAHAFPSLAACSLRCAGGGGRRKWGPPWQAQPRRLPAHQRPSSK